MVNPARLGASLYVPSVHAALESALGGGHPACPRSVIACTEDSIAADDVERAFVRLHHVLPKLSPLSSGPLRFIRPRNPLVLQRLLRLPGIDRVHGFVIPKADADTLPEYLRVLRNTEALLMPTLETAAVFDRDSMREFKRLLQTPAVQRRILALRIGGNDLLRLLGLKRTPGHTIYDTPIGALIPLLIFEFRPAGFRLTGVACDDFSDPDILRLEARKDRLMGLVGKTAIHPRQVRVIQNEFQPTSLELDTAQAIIARASEGVFGMHGTMLEPAVHLDWANEVVASALASGSVSASPVAPRPHVANARQIETAHGRFRS